MAAEHYPKFYFYRGRHGSDRDWIHETIDGYIPVKYRSDIALKYESIYLADGREKANEYLMAKATEFYEKRQSNECT